MGLLRLLVSLFFSFASTSLIKLKYRSHTGALIPQLLLGRIHEQTMFTSLLLLQTFLTCVLQFSGIGSAGLFFFSAFPLFISLALNALFMHGGEISLWTYALAQLSPLLSGTQVLAATLDVFVPLVCLNVSSGVHFRSHESIHTDRTHWR
jgi:hypothetical protein